MGLYNVPYLRIKVSIRYTSSMQYMYDVVDFKVSMCVGLVRLKVRLNGERD